MEWWTNPFFSARCSVTSLRPLFGKHLNWFDSDLLFLTKNCFVRFVSEHSFGLWNQWGNPCANCACRGVSASIRPLSPSGVDSGSKKSAQHLKTQKKYREQGTYSARPGLNVGNIFSSYSTRVQWGWGTLNPTLPINLFQAPEDKKYKHESSRGNIFFVDLLFFLTSFKIQLSLYSLLNSFGCNTRSCTCPILGLTQKVTQIPQHLGRSLSLSLSLMYLIARR